MIYGGADTRNGLIRQELEIGVGYPAGMEYGVQKKGWMDEVQMLKWIEKVWKPLSEQHVTSMILLDSFTAHLTSSVMLEFANCNTEVEIIPPGYTSKLQPMDVGVNKPFKGKTRTCYAAWLVANKNNTNKQLKPTRKLIASWIYNAWTAIAQNTFINSFYGSGFDIARA